MPWDRIKDEGHILVVDDEPVVCQLLEAILDGQGFRHVDSVGSGEEALVALDRTDYHVGLVDKNLPGMDGLALIRAGISKRPQCEFILMTGYASLETAIQAIDLGAFSYLTKPFSEIDLVTTRIEAAMRHSLASHHNLAMLNRLKLVQQELHNYESEVSRDGQVQYVRQALERLALIIADLDAVKPRR